MTQKPGIGDVLTKAVAELAPAPNDEESPHGAFEVILSTPTVDRDGEKVASDEWHQPLPSHIPFDVDHGMSVASTVGSGIPRIEADGTLRVSGTYASTPLAQQTRSLVNEGHVRTVSVAFLRRSAPMKGGTSRVTRELLNGAFVAVPANPEALVLSSKAGARNSMSDQQKLQQAHDMMVSLGANCPNPSGGKAAPMMAAPMPDAAPMDPGMEDSADPGDLAQGLEATLDEALALVENTDLTTLPPEVAQAIAMLQAAESVADELLDALGIVDPDEDSTAAPKSAAAAMAAAADDEAAELALRIRVLALSAQTV